VHLCITSRPCGGSCFVAGGLIAAIRRTYCVRCQVRLLASTSGWQAVCQKLYPAWVSWASSDAYPPGMTTPTLDTGYRWATITADDSSGVLYIVAFLSFTYSSLTFIARCFIKWRVLGIDDAAALAAQVCRLCALLRDTTRLRR
jgi:hypothetical protein